MAYTRYIVREHTLKTVLYVVCEHVFEILEWSGSTYVVGTITKAGFRVGIGVAYIFPNWNIQDALAGLENDNKTNTKSLIIRETICNL